MVTKQCRTGVRQQFHGYSTRTGHEFADGWKRFQLLAVTERVMFTASLFRLENSFSAQVVFVVLL
jgi:hypothetical protein